MRTEKPAEPFAHANKADAHAVFLVARVHAPFACELAYGVFRMVGAEGKERVAQGRQR